MSKENKEIFITNNMGFRDNKTICVKRTTINEDEEIHKDKKVYFNKSGKMIERRTETYTRDHIMAEILGKDCKPDFVYSKREYWDDKGFLTSLEFAKTYLWEYAKFCVECNFDKDKKVYLVNGWIDYGVDDYGNDIEITNKEDEKEFSGFYTTTIKNIRTAIGKKPLIDKEVLKLCNGDVQKAIKMMNNDNHNVKGEERV